MRRYKFTNWQMLFPQSWYVDAQTRATAELKLRSRLGDLRDFTIYRQVQGTSRWQEMAK